MSVSYAFPMASMYLGGRRSSLSCSYKVLLLVAHCATLALFTFYTADLTSRFTAVDEEPMLKTFEDAVTHNYKVIISKGSIGRSVLEQAQQGSGLYRMYHEIILKNGVRTCYTLIKTQKHCYYNVCTYCPKATTIKKDENG